MELPVARCSCGTLPRLMLILGACAAAAAQRPRSSFASRYAAPLPTNAEVGDLAATIAGAWRRFLIELALAQNYQLLQALDAMGAAPRNPVLDDLLPSLLYVKAVAVLDAALKQLLLDKGLKVPKKPYGAGLKSRIDFLSDQAILPNSTVLHGIRESRNDVAHEFEGRTTWAELEQDVLAVQSVLENLGFVPLRPQFEPFAERSAGHESTDPQILLEFDYRVGLKERDVVAAEITWTKHVHKDDG